MQGSSFVLVLPLPLVLCCLLLDSRVETLVRHALLTFHVDGCDLMLVSFYARLHLLSSLDLIITPWMDPGHSVGVHHFVVGCLD